ncbi:MAG: hypothetical protein Fur0022_01900 [Anaerolineales bacterium]
MNKTPLFFKLVYKPLTGWAARRTLVGRNRSLHEPQKGRFAAAEVSHLLDQSWQRFDELVPDMSQESTVGSRMNVRLAALSLAMLHTLMGAGVERKYAIELIGDICWKVYQSWGWVGKFIRLFRHSRLEDTSKRVLQDGDWPMSFPFNPPGYRARYVPTEGGLGFDVIRCPVAEYFHAHGASDLAVHTWCMLDYPLAEMLELKLMRTQTLATGDGRCDFRWFPVSGER